MSTIIYNRSNILTKKSLVFFKHSICKLIGTKVTTYIEQYNWVIEVIGSCLKTREWCAHNTSVHNSLLYALPGFIGMYFYDLLTTHASVNLFLPPPPFFKLKIHQELSTNEQQITLNINLF